MYSARATNDIDFVLAPSAHSACHARRRSSLHVYYVLGSAVDPIIILMYAVPACLPACLASCVYSMVRLSCCAASVLSCLVWRNFMLLAYACGLWSHLCRVRTSGFQHANGAFFVYCQVPHGHKPARRPNQH